jgi:protein-S-isoprenylcysteine O-methyltransferase Ste14
VKVLGAAAAVGLFITVAAALVVSEGTRRKRKLSSARETSAWLLPSAVAVVALAALAVDLTPSLPPAVRLAGAVVMTAALVGVVYAYVLLFRNGCFSFDSARVGEASPITSGPYRLARHPVYAGLGWFVLGSSIAYRIGLLPFAVATFVYGWRQGRREEQSFGRAYVARARDRVFPFDRHLG